MKQSNIELQCLCGSKDFSLAFHYHEPPKGEIHFNFSAKGEKYSRDVWRCDACGHFLSVHQMDDGLLYQGDYVSANYGGDGIIRNFDRINALPPEKSDNIGRVRRILEFWDDNFQLDVHDEGLPAVLDIGSGLCVFLYRMKSAGWDCTGVDMDKRLVDHARRHVGIKAYCGNFTQVKELMQYELITINKVLEHVREPVEMLALSKKFLKQHGYIYIEVPDGEEAAKEGKSRGEFFIDHHHVFSKKSLECLIEKAGLKACLLERIHEPSTKYTLFAFCKL